MLAALLALLAACGDGEPIAPQQALDYDATMDEVLDGSREAMAALRSYRFTSIVTIPPADGASGRGPSQLTIDGVWSAPQSYELDGVLTNDDGEMPQRYVVVDGRWYLEDDGLWREFPPNPVGVPRFRGRSEIPELKSARFSTNVTSGVTYLIEAEGTFDVGAGTVELLPFTTTLVISLGSLRLLAREMTVELPDGGTWTERIGFSGFNKRVEIDLPSNREDRPLGDAPDPTPTPTP